MTRHARAFALLFLSLVVAPATANPLSKLFMKKRKGAIPSPQEAPSPSSSDKEVCVSAEALTQAESEVRTLRLAREETLRQQTQAVELAEKCKSDLDEYRKTAEKQLQQLGQASESAMEVSKLHAEFATRLEEVQWKATSEVASLKADIAAKEQELQQKREMIKKLEAMDNEWRASIDDQKVHVQQQMMQLKQELEAQLKSQQEENALLVGEKIGLETKLALLNEMHEQALRDHEAMVKRKLEELRESEADVLLLQQTTELVAAKDQAIEKLERMMAQQKEESDASLSSLRAEFDEFQLGAAATSKRLDMDLRSAIEESRSLKQRLEETQTKLAETISMHEAAVSDFLSQLRRVETDRDSLQANVGELQVALDVVKVNWAHAAQDAKYWNDLFQNRPYVNFTHVAGDAYSYAAQTTQRATESLASVSAPVIEKIAPIAKHVYETRVVPTTIKSKEMYDVHMKTHVDRARTEILLPVYNMHIAPRYRKFKDAVAELGEAAFDSMVTQFESFCPIAVESLKSAEKKWGKKLSPKLMESAEYACSHPEDEVLVFLKGAALLFVLVFHRMFLRLIFGVIRSIFQTVWFLSPLRWFLVWILKSPTPVKPETQSANQEPNCGTPARNGSKKVTGNKN